MLVQELYSRLEEIIESLPAGGRLPSEPELAKSLGVSRATLREAMRTFETEGRIRRKQGVGTFVVRPIRTFETGLEVLESLDSIAERIGLEVSVADLDIKICDCSDDTRERLNLDSETTLTCISRTIYAENRPIAYLVDKVVSDFLKPDEIPDDFHGSVLDLFLERGKPMLGDSRCEINAVPADSQLAKALNIQRGDPLLEFDSVLYTVDGQPIDISKSYFLPGYFRFHVVRKVKTHHTI